MGIPLDFSNTPEGETFYIWWDEFDRKDLPFVCVECGAKAVAWEGTQIAGWQVDTPKKETRSKNVQMPVCSKHQRQSRFVAKTGISCAAVTGTGVWTRKLHEGFLEALEKHRKKDVKDWKEENEGTDPDDVPDEKLPPGLRTEPELPDVGSQKSAAAKSSLYLIAGVGIFFLLVVGCAGCGIVGMMMVPFLMTRR
jgi:hypothetical protein